MQKIMISVGEASGDLNGASVALALKTIAPDCQLIGMGGQAMRAAGVEIVYDIADLGVIGLVEVIKNLPRLFRLKAMLVKLMETQRPDVLVVIDYPGFNMRLAKEAKKLGIPVVSYISPSVWAWGRGRAKGVAKTVDVLAAIFPFEADIYRQAGANVTFVGHPLLDIVKPTKTREEAYRYFNVDSQKPMVLLLPGSRVQEITNLLPVMLEAAERIAQKIPACQFFLPVASTIPQEMLHNIISQYDVTVALTTDCTYDLMGLADVSIAASGTATLEAAIMELPTVVIYKVAALTGFFGKFLVKIPDISLPNIVAGRRIVPELLQSEVNAQRITQETLAILTDPARRQKIIKDLIEVRAKLGETGAVQRVAEVIVKAAIKNSEGRK